MQHKTYRERIQELTDIDPRWIEAWMRITHGTLDQLSPEQFKEEVVISAACVLETSKEDNEGLARSYGL